MVRIERHGGRWRAEDARIRLERALQGTWSGGAGAVHAMIPRGGDRDVSTVRVDVCDRCCGAALLMTSGFLHKARRFSEQRIGDSALSL